jgi:aminoglycoside phosphotransferase (APT) family kinase protein
MSGWLTKLAGGGLLLLLVVSICLGGYNSLLSHRLALSRQQLSEQQKTLAQQSGLIATLRTDDARNRALIAEQQRREHQLRQHEETYQRKLRDALKSDKCGNSPMPAAVIEFLQQNATGTPANRPVTP